MSLTANIRQNLFKIYQNIRFEKLIFINLRYEKLANAFEGFNGYFASTADQIKQAFNLALKETTKPSIINIAINPSADRKAQVFLFKTYFMLNLKIKIFIFFYYQQFPWLTKSKV